MKEPLAHPPAGAGRAAGAIRRRGGLDRRMVGALPWHPSQAMGTRFMAVLRAAITDATRRGVTRAGIAAALGLTPKALEHVLSPSGERVLRLDLLLKLLAPEGPLPEPNRRMVLEWIDTQTGRVAVSILDADPDEAPVPAQVMQITAAHGRVAQTVERVTGARSAGGEAITPEEARELLGQARAQERELAELIATLERITGDRR